MWPFLEQKSNDEEHKCTQHFDLENAKLKKKKYGDPRFYDIRCKVLINNPLS